MTPSDFLRKLNEIKDFVRQIKENSLRIKGICDNNHTYLIGKAGSSFPKSIVRHDKGTCSVYFSGDYFSVEMSYCERPFKAIISSEKVIVESESIENYITDCVNFKQLWDIALGIETKSIAEREVESLKAEIARANRNTQDIRRKIKELEAVIASK